MQTTKCTHNPYRHTYLIPMLGDVIFKDHTAQLIVTCISVNHSRHIDIYPFVSMLLFFSFFLFINDGWCTDVTVLKKSCSPHLGTLLLPAVLLTMGALPHLSCLPFTILRLHERLKPYDFILNLLKFTAF